MGSRTLRDTSTDYSWEEIASKGSFLNSSHNKIRNKDQTKNTRKIIKNTPKPEE